jgi:hypothetical protein
LLVTPLALTYFAALIHRYPFNGSRVMVFAVPALVLLAGAAVPWLLGRAPRAAAAGLVGVVLMAAGNAAYHIAVPWDQPDVPGAVRHLLAQRRPGEPVVVNDWTHLYYLRALDPAPLVEPPTAPLAGRCWVVVSTYGETHEWRLALARALAPAGWRLERAAELHHACVAAFVPPVP